MAKESLLFRISPKVLLCGPFKVIFRSLSKIIKSNQIESYQGNNWSLFLQMKLDGHLTVAFLSLNMTNLLILVMAMSTPTIRVILTPGQFQNITTATVNTRQKRPGISKMGKKLQNRIMDICLYSPNGSSISSPSAVLGSWSYKEGLQKKKNNFRRLNDPSKSK